MWRCVKSCPQVEYINEAFVLIFGTFMGLRVSALGRLFLVLRLFRN